MLCILYTILISTSLGIAALLTEQALAPGRPRRWIWVITMPMCVLVPAIFRGQHKAAMPMAEIAGIGNYDPLVMDVWKLASAILLLWALGNAWRVHRAIASRRESMGPTVIDGVPVVITRKLGPAATGFWRARVLMPQWVLALSAPERSYILHHEDEHRRANDARLLTCASVLLIMAPWNIALWWQLRRLTLAVEADCDNRVVANLGDAHAYGELLLKVAEATQGPRLQPGLLSGTGMLEQRLALLLTPVTRTHVQRLVLAAIAVTLLVVVLAVPHPVAP